MQKNNPTTHHAKAGNEFTIMSFLWRFAAALVLVFATYNPSQKSVFHWIKAAWGADGIGPEHYFVIVILLIGWAIFWVATWQALDTIGVLLAAALLGTGVWLLMSLGVITPDSTSGVVWIVLVCISALLTIGLSWSHIWRRLTGQFDVDEVSE